MATDGTNPQGSEEYRKANRALWNEWTDINARSASYDLEGFKAGKTSLKDFELEEIGEVVGKTLLHLQCHFGLDTLSLTRLGAKATGIDFSDRSINLARQLNQELGLDAEFVCSDVFDLPEVLSGQFDIVYTSHGVLPWLSDIQRWGKVIAHFLKPGGVFYISEFHPFAYVFDDSDSATELRVAYPYFHSAEPLTFDVQGSYADRNAEVNQKVEYEWVHSVGDILNALISAQLSIRFFHERSFSIEALLPSLMEQNEDGMWRLKDTNGSIPLMFSLKAVKES